MSEAATFEKLCEHYRDTFDDHIKTLDSRNRLFFFLLISVGLFTVNITSAETSAEVISQVVENSAGIRLGSGPEVFSSLLWLAVAGMAIRYFQLAVQNERQYAYLHALEKEINKHYQEDSIAFTREGISYNSNYPKFSSWLHFVYTKVFPALLATIAIANIYNEIGPEPWTINSLINISSFLILEITIILYVVFQNRTDAKN